MSNTDFFIESPAFADGAEIPKTYTAEGRNMSPPLEWSKIPPHAREYVIVCEDPDAPSGRPYIHWVIYNIPGNRFELREGIPTTMLTEAGISQGLNSAGAVGYLGPKPPPGTGKHRYYFRIFALDEALNLKAGLTYAEVMDAIRNHIDAEAECMGKAWYH